MPRPHLILLSALLFLALPGWAVAAPANEKAAQARPLNLSLPRDVLQSSGAHEDDEAVERNLQAPATPAEGTDAPVHPSTLPYGAGYEHRRQEFGGAGAGAGAGPGGGARRGR